VCPYGSTINPTPPLPPVFQPVSATADSMTIPQ